MTNAFPLSNPDGPLDGFNTEDPLSAYLSAMAEQVEGLRGDELRAYEELDYFSEYVMGYDNAEYRPPSRFIKSIYEELQYGTERSLLILGPRNSAKSQAVTVNYVCWKIGRNPLIRFLLVFAAKEVQGYAFSNQIASVIEDNQRFKSIFGDLSPKSRSVPWSSETRTVDRPTPPGGLKDSTITIAGFGSNLPSKRADESVIDDIVTGDNAYSPTIQNQIEQFVFQTVFPILVPGGRRIILGSRWDIRDLYTRVAQRWNIDMPEADGEIALDELHALYA